jgi:ABC-type microcin C transport system duplicated ATPase subunit YejF
MTASQEELRRLRGGVVGLVLQEAAEALNPVYTVGFQIAETVSAHHGVTRQEAHKRAIELLAEVAVGEPENIARAYPHELSGARRRHPGAGARAA